MRRTYKSKNYKLGYKQAIKDMEVSLANISERWLSINKGTSFEMGITLAHTEDMRILIQNNGCNENPIFINKFGDTIIITPESNIA